jgi:ferredoxin-type protein NapH
MIQFARKRKRFSKVQKRSRKYLFRRAGWYLLGLFLFYAPFALFNRGLNWLLGNGTDGSIHDTCLRMPLTDLFNSKGLDLATVRGISFLLLIGSAFLIGPFFCGRLCAAGAFTEYLSRLWPDKWKIDWSRIVNPTPIRYGFLAGFIIAPFFAGSLACAYCGYGFFQRLLDGGFWGDIGVLGSTTILTAFLWFVVFGIFTKGGRGYCNFMCPVGAIQSLMHRIGAIFGFTYKLKFDKGKCVTCQSCVRACPMRALKKEDNSIYYNIHNCITCRQCTAACPTNAITYGRGERGWDKQIILTASLDKKTAQEGA